MNHHRAPGIQKVLGAFLLDIGLLALFWFGAMIFATAIWVLGIYISNAGTIPNSQPGPLASMWIGVSALYLSIIALSAIRGKHVLVKSTPMTKKNSAMLAVSSGSALFLLVMFCTHFLSLLGFDMRPGNQTILENAGTHAPIMVAIFAVTIAPIFEELLFRKQIFARFQKEGYVVSAYFLSSILFAFLHEPLPTQGLARWALILLLYAGIGAAFAWVYQKTGSLWPAILAHASYNLFGIGALLLG